MNNIIIADTKEQVLKPVYLDQVNIQNVYLMIGIIGSGKSSWAKDKVRTNDNTVIINRDSLRYMINGGEYIFDEKYEKMIKFSTYSCLRHAIEAKFDVIIDESNISMEKRMVWLDVINYSITPNIVKVTYVWCTETERNLDLRMRTPKGQSREKWEEVYNGMIEVFEPPTIDELPPNGDIIQYRIGV